MLQRPEKRRRRERAVRPGGRAPAGARAPPSPGRSATLSSGFEIASTKIARVVSVMAASTAAASVASTKRHANPPPPGLLAEERGRRAVEVLAGHDVVPRPEAAQEERAERPHPRGGRRARSRRPRAPPASPPASCGSACRTARRRTRPPGLPRPRRPARGPRTRRRWPDGREAPAGSRRTAGRRWPARRASRSAAGRSLARPTNRATARAGRVTRSTSDVPTCFPATWQILRSHRHRFSSRIGARAAASLTSVGRSHRPRTKSLGGFRPWRRVSPLQGTVPALLRRRWSPSPRGSPTNDPRPWLE